MVHSVLEYCAPVGDPYLEGDKNNLEKIQGVLLVWYVVITY